MDSTTKKKVEHQLDVGLAERGLLDPRSAYRNLLRDLKARDSGSYDRAAGYYSDKVVPSVVAGADAVETWIDYGRFIGQLTETGELMAIDPTGRAAKYSEPIRSGDLVLFVADGGRTGAFVVVSPLVLSPAQSATVDLLVEGKLALQ